MTYIHVQKSAKSVIMAVGLRYEKWFSNHSLLPVLRPLVNQFDLAQLPTRLIYRKHDGLAN